MIATLMGTPYQPDTTNAIVFLEDVHEKPYCIDRMLTTLALGGMFDKAAGIIFGRCSDCGVKGPSLSLEEILRDRFGTLPIPAISGLSFGHIEQKLVYRSAPGPRSMPMRGWCGWRRGRWDEKIARSSRLRVLTALNLNYICQSNLRGRTHFEPPVRDYFALRIDFQRQQNAIRASLKFNFARTFFVAPQRNDF
jgi:hypothetical protein